MPFPAEDRGLCLFQQQLLCQGCPSADRLAAGLDRLCLLINTWAAGKQNHPEGLRAAASLERELSDHSTQADLTQSSWCLTSCPLFPPEMSLHFSSSWTLKCRALPLQVTDVASPISHLSPFPGKQQSPSKKSHPVLTHSIQHNQIKKPTTKAV